MQIYSYHAFLIASILSQWIAITSFADDLSLRNQFLKGAERIPTLISGASIRAKVTFTRKYILLDEPVARRELSKIKENPDSILSTERTIGLHLGETLDSGVNARGVHYLKAMNNSYGFILFRPTADKQFTINSLMSSSEILNSKFRDESAEMQNSATSAIFATWGFQSQSLGSLIKLPDFDIQQVTEIIKEGVTFVRVDCSFPFSPSHKHILRNAYFLCDPQLNWAVREFGCDGPTETAKLRIVNTFGDSFNGFPIAKKSVLTASNSAMPSFTSESITEVEVISPSPSASEFTLSHYGFPEPVFESSWFNTWVKYLVAGFACMAIAYWFKHR